jgi:phage terminase large subunit
MPRFRMARDSLQDRFLKSTAKIQLLGGGYANGKTSVACIKALRLAKDYPGSNGLIARSTYPKLNDTIRKEFLKWTPDHWIKNFPRSKNSDNTCILTNGTTINFRYISQQGKSSGEATTSNLLSATYDWIIVDQMEDPEIVHKDFLDLLGRLRGMTPYIGDNPNMPDTGPRILIMTTNPTRNWLYKRLAKPVFDFNENKFNEFLLCDSDEYGKPILDENNRPTPIIEIFEGSTYENKDNLEPDFIKTLEASYQGQMRERFLLGRWAAYEGLVYPAFDESTHTVSNTDALSYLEEIKMTTSEMKWLEGYDYGLAVPACYLLGFVDPHGNVILIDGWHEKEIADISEQAKMIKEIRTKHGVDKNNILFADPDIFRRKASQGKTVGLTIAGMLQEGGIICRRGNNNIANGIIKVSQYLIPQRMHENPFDGTMSAQYLYVNEELDFFMDEINGYYWKKNSSGEIEDKPMDKDDHALDTLKYMLTNRPEISTFIYNPRDKPIGLFQWAERDLPEPARRGMYG